jgi:hypothetical protein
MSSSYHADLDGGAVIPPENIKAICSELKYNPKTRLLRFCAPKTKIEHKAGRKQKYPDYTPYETEKGEEFAGAAEYEFKTDEPYSSEYQTSASESDESSSATAEEASDSEENAESDDDDDGGANQDDSDEETSGGRSVRFSERRYEDKEPSTTARAGTPAPERKNAEKNVSPDRVRAAAAATGSGRNRKSEKNEKAQTVDKSAKRGKRSRNDAKSDDDRQSFTAGGSGADDDADDADERFNGSVDRRAVPRVFSAKSGGRSRSKRSNNSSAGANKREKRVKIRNPFTSRSKSARRDVEQAFGRRTDFKTASSSAVSGARVKGGDTDGEYSEPVRRRIGRIIEAGVVPPDNDVGRKRRRGAAASKRKSTHVDAADNDDDEWAPGKTIPADAAYW